MTSDEIAESVSERAERWARKREAVEVAKVAAPIYGNLAGLHGKERSERCLVATEVARDLIAEAERQLGERDEQKD